jgi:thymidine kinase/SAM-dependent methyltransferase
MSITVLTGPSGSGKSRTLIKAVNEASAAGRRVSTFLSKAVVARSRDPSSWCHSTIGCQEEGLVCPLDHLVSSQEGAAILRTLPSGTLVAFDEAHLFDPSIATAWMDASNRDLEVLIATPSTEQTQLLGERPTVKQLSVTCGRCGIAEAFVSLVFPGDRDATPLCSQCEAAVIHEARSKIVRRLKDQAPYPGEETIYQPVEISPCHTWRVLRPDSAKRADLMRNVIDEVERMDGVRPTFYIDLGCNTGYFCHRMAQFGLASRGVDLLEDDIEVARLIDSFFHRDHSHFVVADVHEYLRATRQQTVDVTSAFSVIQWLILQKSLQHGLEALQWLFEKTERICFLEMGYAAEEIYQGKLPQFMDRAWVHEVMEARGLFDDIRCYDAGEHGLMRDLFVGIKSANTASPPSTTIAPATGSSFLDDEAELEQRVLPVLGRLLAQESFWNEYFGYFEERGFHLTPVDRHQPIPDTRTLGSSVWRRKKTAAGIDLNIETQLELLREAFPRFRSEYEALPTAETSEPGRFTLANDEFSGTDALGYYCMIRHFQPRRIIEVGTGVSTLLAAEAAEQNDSTEIIAIDSRMPELIANLPLVSAAERRPVEDLPASFFDQLEANDILSIDSSHVSRIGGDVNFLFLEVLPRLVPGVIVQVRGVLLPDEYPKDWVVDQRRFWNEQYVLQAFLAFNDAWEVLLANNYLAYHHSQEMKKAFPKSPWWGGGGFWIRRKPE